MTARDVADRVGYLGFDVFGTVVDWRSGVARASAPFLARHGIDLDPYDFADQWRALYEPSMEPVRAGRRDWVPLDVLHRESLDAVLARHHRDPGSIADDELVELNAAWERLDPWPDCVAGLTRLKRCFAIGPLSNGHIALMLRLARSGGLPWDVITGAGVTRAYKPAPEAYLRTAEAVGLPPGQVGMVAAHNGDLEAARALGMRTIFVRRPREHGPGQTCDLEPAQDWDVVADSLTEVADALGC